MGLGERWPVAFAPVSGRSLGVSEPWPFPVSNNDRGTIPSVVKPLSPFEAPIEGGDPAVVVSAVRQAALVFYVDGVWKPFPIDSPESRVTKPAVDTHVQFNHLPGRPPHAEYRGPLGRWWVRIDAGNGMPCDEPMFVPNRPEPTSTYIN